MGLLNGWTNNASFVQARYRKVASPPNSVQIQAFISGNAASNGTFFKLPAGYVPTNSQGFAVGCTSSADSTDGRVDTSGNLSIANVVMPAAQTFFINDVISLD